MQWTRLSASRFDDVSFGSDGTIWATVLPVNGVWGVYQFSGNNWTKVTGSVKQLSVRTQDEVWGVDGAQGIWKYVKGTWKQVSGALVSVAVGVDGAVWGVDAGGVLYELSQTTGLWQPAKGTYLDVDVKDATQIVAVDTNFNVLLGAVQAYPSVDDPIETPFVLKAYSGGSAVYSDAQRAQVGWAELTLNGKSLLGVNKSSLKAPASGLNVVAVSDAGNPLLIQAYATGSDPAANDAILNDMAKMLTGKAQPAPLNLYAGFQEVGGLNNGLGLPNADGTANPGPNWSLTFDDHVIYTGKQIAGAYSAPVAAAQAYSVSFRYVADGTLDVANAGPDAGLISETLPAASAWTLYRKDIVHTQAGVHQLTFRCNSASRVELQDATITLNSDAAMDPQMVFVLAHDDAATALSNSTISFFESLGAKRLRDLRPKGSYCLAYDSRTQEVIFEDMNNAGHVLFVSEGKAAVVDNYYTVGSSVYLAHKSTVVQYDVANAKVLNTINLKDTNLPPPFNVRIDAIIAKGNSLLLTRGSMWMLVAPDLSAVLDGPDVIGSGQLPLNVKPFTGGIDAATPSPDGNAYFFKGSTFAKVDPSWSKVLSSGTLGATDNEFANLPTSFTQRIHTAYLSNATIGLMSGNAQITYDPVQKLVVSGPVSLVSGKPYLGLPVSFRVEPTPPAKPFFNHTVFEGNRLKNFDISVQAGQGFPGWSPESFSKYNTNCTANFVSPPIRTKALASKMPDVLKTFGANTNDLLAAYEKVGVAAGWDVTHFGGNTITLSLVDKTRSYWQSHTDAGKPSGYADLRPGEYYSLRIWARTTDSVSFSVGAYTGSQSSGADTVNLSPLTVTPDVGWQLLTWGFHNSSKSASKDVSFTMSQGSQDASLHSLYGPVMTPTVYYPDDKFVKELFNLQYCYIATGVPSSTSQKRVGYDGAKLYTCDTCQTVNGQLGFNERFAFFPGRTPRTVIISSYGNFGQGGVLNLCVASGSLATSADDGAAASWYVLQDVNDNIYFLNFDTDMVLAVDSSGVPQVVKAPATIDGLAGCAFVVQLEKQYQGYQLYPKNVYVEAAFAKDPVAGGEIIFFRRGVFCSYDVIGGELVVSPTNCSDHSWFQYLPKPFATVIDSAFQLSTTKILLFSGTRWILWDIATGRYGAGVDAKVQRLGPGAHAWFSRLPAPFNKRIDASMKLDATNVILVSQNNYVQWDLTGNKMVGAPGLLTNGVFAGVDANFRASLDSAAEVPGKPGQAYLFSAANWIVYDLVNQKTLEGPNLLGPTNDRFAAMVPPFVPSKAETCGIYQDVITHHTDFPKVSCQDDANREYNWVTNCWFNIPTCDAQQGVWNDQGGFCGTALSKGSVPIKTVDAGIRQQYTQMYSDQCKTVDEYDYQAMQQKEAGKISDATNTLTAEQKAKQDLVTKINNEKANLARLNGILQGMQATLTKDTDLACHPNVVCLKDVNRGRSTIPLACNPDVINSLLAKPTLTNDDIAAIIAIVKKTNSQANFPIQKHPDYPKYVSTQQVNACPSTKRKVITDFPITAFPDLQNYIRNDKLLPIAAGAASSANLVPLGTNGTTGSTTITTPTTPSVGNSSVNANTTNVSMAANATPVQAANGSAGTASVPTATPFQAANGSAATTSATIAPTQTPIFTPFQSPQPLSTTVGQPAVPTVASQAVSQALLPTFSPATALFPSPVSTAVSTQGSFPAPGAVLSAQASPQPLTEVLSSADQVARFAPAVNRAFAGCG